MFVASTPLLFTHSRSDRGKSLPRARARRLLHGLFYFVESLVYPRVMTGSQFIYHTHYLRVHVGDTGVCGESYVREADLGTGLYNLDLG